MLVLAQKGPGNRSEGPTVSTRAKEGTAILELVVPKWPLQCKVAAVDCCDDESAEPFRCFAAVFICAVLASLGTCLPSSPLCLRRVAVH